jgi:parallel beta-helix repeat protein
MIGNVHNSYVKGSSVNRSFNRGVALHGTNFLRIEENVFYNNKGHNIFIEDAVERNNYIYKNLIVKTKRSWSLLNTD